MHQNEAGLFDLERRLQQQTSKGKARQFALSIVGVVSLGAVNVVSGGALTPFALTAGATGNNIFVIIFV